jgi:HEPN domain-containing protein
MSASPETPEAEAARWLRYALEDLGMARHISDEDAPLRYVCTLAQQAAEKAIKAGLVLQGVEPPKTDNLGRLKGLLTDDWRLATVPMKLGALTESAVTGRYPGDWEIPSEEETHNALELATTILELMRADLADRGVSADLD